MKPGRIVLIVLGFIVLCLAYYCLFPKYDLEVSESGVLATRINRITGEVVVGTAAREGKEEGIRVLNGRLF